MGLVEGRRRHGLMDGGKRFGIVEGARWCGLVEGGGMGWWREAAWAGGRLAEGLAAGSGDDPPPRRTRFRGRRGADRRAAPDQLRVADADLICVHSSLLHNNLGAGFPVRRAACRGCIRLLVDGRRYSHNPFCRCSVISPRRTPR